MSTSPYPLRSPWRSLAAAGLATLCLAVSSTASAALFEDDEARRAILDLRQRVEAQRLAVEREAEIQRQDNTQLRRSLLDLQNQIEALRGEIARLTGQNERVLRNLADMQRDVADMQRRQKDIVQGVDDRLRKIEPSKVSVDGREFIADPSEARDFETALAIFRKGEFVAAQNAFAEFIRRYPQSGFRPTALYWLGNAQYANRDYKGAIGNFRALLAASPDHPRASEAVLSIASCQIELKDNSGARKTLDELVKAYPQSEAAVAARDRLARMR